MTKRQKILILISIVAALAPTASYARTSSPELLSETTPLFDYINQINSSLEIDSKGIAQSTGYIRTMTGEKVALTVRLQQYNNSTWNTLKTWSDEDLYSCTVQKDRAVSQGYSYRVETTGKVYDAKGKLLESVTVKSQTEYY